MIKPLRFLLLVAVLAFCGAVGATQTLAAELCPNEQLRIENNSTGLADCRAYELVSPDLNHAAGGLAPGGQASSDGGTFLYQTLDAPVDAHSTSIDNVVRATRDPVAGWSGVSLSPTLTMPSTAYFANVTVGLSTDLTSTAEVSDQPLSGVTPPSGQNVFVRRPDGTYRLVSKVGTRLNPLFQNYTNRGISWGNADFSNVYLKFLVPQLPEDPSPDSTYEWSEAKGLRLLGYLPDGTLGSSSVDLPSGILQPASEDGRYVSFTTANKLYLRIDDTHTVELGAFVLDPQHFTDVDQAGITPDGTTLLFTSRAELTPDANTGKTGGTPNETGRDLYSYDTADGHLADLTPDTNPTDASTGADIKNVLAVTPDASYVYFTATGALASGAVAGSPSLYVWHAGHIDFVAPTGVRLPGGFSYFYATPDGRHAAFASTDRLTGYDNTDPTTGLPHSEVYEYTFGSGLECASCRADATRPTGESLLPKYQGLGPAGTIRVMSEDGRRLFFESTDAVVPLASSGHTEVFEFQGGRASALSRLDGEFDSRFLDASASGDDVFINTYDTLIPGPTNGDYTVIDARVGGGFPARSTQRCSGAACEAPATPPPALSLAASVGFPGAVQPVQTPSGSAGASKLSVSRIATIKGTAGLLKVTVPGAGHVTVSGSGLRTTRRSCAKAQTVTVRIALSAAAANSLKRRRSLRTRVSVVFSDAAGHASRATFALTFRARPDGKGR